MDGEQQRRRDWYGEMMKRGEAEYLDVIQALVARGLPTKFTQTGGMNAALESQLETGEILLITDADDSLSWRRDEQRGWGVGRYPPGEAAADGPSDFSSTTDSSCDALLCLIKELLLPPTP